eukprot:32672-Pleurochrysis_carterae.AAC.1
MTQRKVGKKARECAAAEANIAGRSIHVQHCFGRLARLEGGSAVCTGSCSKSTEWLQRPHEPKRNTLYPSDGRWRACEGCHGQRPPSLRTKTPAALQHKLVGTIYMRRESSTHAEQARTGGKHLRTRHTLAHKALTFSGRGGHRTPLS